MDKLLILMKRYIWVFIACYVVLFLLSKVFTLGGQGQLLLLAVVATLVPMLGDYFRERNRR